MQTLSSLQPLEPRRLLSFAYSMVDLGVVNQPLGSAVLDLNDQGIVLTQGAVWTIRSGKGYQTDIDPSSITPHKLGNNLAIAGAFSASQEAAQIRYKHGLRGRTIEPLALQGVSAANALNAHDSAVGRMKESGPFHAFLAIYQPQNFTVYKTTDLTAAAAGTGLDVDNAIDLSAANQILLTGRETQSGMPGAAVATVTSHGLRFLELSGTGAPGEEILPRELNEMGEAAGAIRTPDQSRAVLWSTSRHGVQLTLIPDLGGSESAARGLNDLGLVVGFSTTSLGKQHATLFDRASGNSRDLNLLTDTLGLTLRLATAVNNSGQIAAEATDAQGHVHAVVLLPTAPYPVPPSGVKKTASGVVIINGTSGKDNINIEQDSPDAANNLIVTLNQKHYSFNIADVFQVRVHAGAGNDRITLQVGISRIFQIYGDDGNDSISASIGQAAGSDVSLYGGEGNDRITTDGNHDKFFATGDGGNDTLTGEAGGNVFWGGTGNDLLQAGDDLVTLSGERGNDTLLGSIGNDSIDGGSGDDSISSFAGDDLINAGAGNDFIDSGDGADRAFGGLGNDSILAGNGDDYIHGDQGNDTLFGQSGDDTLAGDIAVTRDTFNLSHAPGNDLINGGRGRDYLLGSADLDPRNDTLIGGAGGDILNARDSDSVPDATSDDIVPREKTAGNSPFAIDQTATIILNLPAHYPARVRSDHARSPVTIPAGAGDFAGSPFFAESDGTLRMRAHLSRNFTIGEFFDNWGIYVDADHFGGYVNPPTAGRYHAAVTINGEPYSRDRIVQPNDALVIDVRL